MEKGRAEEGKAESRGGGKGRKEKGNRTLVGGNNALVVGGQRPSLSVTVFCVISSILILA